MIKTFSPYSLTKSETPTASTARKPVPNNEVKLHQQELVASITRNHSNYVLRKNHSSPGRSHRLFKTNEPSGARVIHAVQKTLAYHAVFDYPLTPFEIGKYLIGPATASPTDIQTAISHHEPFQSKNGKFTLGKTSQFDENINTTSWLFITKAARLIQQLAKYLPSIKLVAVSGSTAALNSKSTDDIDIFIICHNNTGWITRLALLFFLTLTRQRVSTQPSADNSGKLCANLIFETNNLTPDKQDLFSAMEIAHLKVILNRDHTFQHFLLANRWIQNILPNFWSISHQEWQMDRKPRDYSANKKLFRADLLLMRRLNSVAKFVQQTAYRLKYKKSLSLSDQWHTDYRTITLAKYSDILNTN